jgi:uncharacterized protein YbjT (DUF2867 family)
MKVVLFGATGGTGKNAMARALAAGHEVVAVARKPEAITTKHERLRVVAGDVLSADTLGPALAGAEGVISSIGPSDNKKPGTLLSQGLRNIVGAAEKAGVRRLVFESGLMMSEGSELSLTGRLGITVYRTYFRALYEDKLVAEQSVRGSGLEWVIVRPPALTHEPASGSYIAGPAAKVNPAKSLSHEDVADCLVRALTEPGWARQVVNVGH